MRIEPKHNAEEIYEKFGLEYLKKSRDYWNIAMRTMGATALAVSFLFLSFIGIAVQQDKISTIFASWYISNPIILIGLAGGMYFGFYEFLRLGIKMAKLQKQQIEARKEKGVIKGSGSLN